MTLLLSTSLILFVFLCWLVSANQQCRTERVYFSEMCSAPAVTGIRWFVWTAAAHIKCNASSVYFVSGSQVLYSISYSFVSVSMSAFDMLSGWKFTALCHSSSCNLLMCHTVSYVMNKHADVQRDECWLEMRWTVYMFERKGLQREERQGHGI